MRAIQQHVEKIKPEKLESKVVDKFLQRYPFNPKTAIAYRSHLKNFFEVIGANPDTYFENGRDYPPF